MEEVFANYDIDLDTAYRQLKQRMDAVGLPFSERTMTYNTTLAQELAKWAETQPIGQKIHDILYRASFVDCINLGQVSDLLAVFSTDDLNKEEAETVLNKRRYQQAVENDWVYCQKTTVAAIPTYTCQDKRLTGSQLYDVFEKTLQSAGAIKKGE